MRDILPTVNQWIEQDRPIALATVVETWGSAPRGVGSKMAVTADSAIIGSVSGGCVEGAVMEEALAALETGDPKLLKFGVADDTAWEVGLTCGGRINVFVEKFDPTWWSIATNSVTNDKRTVTFTVLDGDRAGQKAMFNASGDLLYATADRDLIDEFKENIPLNSTRITVNDMDVMVDVELPRPHLILIGGVHVAMPLKEFAHQLGFRVSLIDPRQTFATPERFPDVLSISHDYPDEALPELGLDEDTFIAVLTHDPKIDDPALITSLNAKGVSYIGVLSSGRTHEKRVARLKEAGITDEQIARIYTPIGIEIGSKTPEEIALAIMAEIIAVRNGKR